MFTFEVCPREEEDPIRRVRHPAYRGARRASSQALMRQAHGGAAICGGSSGGASMWVDCWAGPVGDSCAWADVDRGQLSGFLDCRRMNQD